MMLLRSVLDLLRPAPDPCPGDRERCTEHGEFSRRLRRLELMTAVVLVVVLKDSSILAGVSALAVSLIGG